MRLAVWKRLAAAGFGGFSLALARGGVAPSLFYRRPKPSSVPAPGPTWEQQGIYELLAGGRA